MLETLTIEIFRGREQERFIVTAGEAQLEMKLTEVKSLGVFNPPPSRTPASYRRREAFSLVFCGPGDRLLQQSMYLMHHDELGELGNIFIVPINRDAAGLYYYEAIFS